MENFPVNKLIDFSWRFGVTVASSGTGKIGKSFMHLNIIYDEDGERKSIFTEMNVDQFHKLLYDLEKAKSSIDIFT